MTFKRVLSALLLTLTAAAMLPIGAVKLFRERRLY